MHTKYNGKKKTRTQTLVRKSWWNIILALLSMRASDCGNHRRRWYRLGSSFNQQVGLGLNVPERHRVTQQASSQRTDGFSLPTISTAPTQLLPRLLSSLSANPYQVPPAPVPHAVLDARVSDWRDLPATKVYTAQGTAAGTWLQHSGTKSPREACRNAGRQQEGGGGGSKGI